MSNKIIGGYLYLLNKAQTEVVIYKIMERDPQTGYYLAYNTRQDMAWGSERDIENLRTRGLFIPSGEQVPVQWLVPQQLRPRRRLLRRLRRLAYAVLSVLAFRLLLRSSISST